MINDFNVLRGMQYVYLCLNESIKLFFSLLILVAFLESDNSHKNTIFLSIYSVLCTTVKWIEYEQAQVPSVSFPEIGTYSHCSPEKCGPTGLCSLHGISSI